MNSNNDLKSGQKLLFMQVLILAVVIILIAFIGLLLQKSSVNTIFQTGFKDYQNSSKLLKDISSVHANLYRIKGMVVAGQDKQEITRISDQQIALMAEDINLAKKAMEGGISDEQKKFYQAILDNLVAYQKSAVQVIRLAPMNTGSAYLSSANEKMEAISQLLGQLIDFESNAAEQSYNSSKTVFYIVLIALIVLLILSIVFIPSFIKKMLNQYVIDPLQETNGVLREFASGKYNRSLTWDADDVIGELVESVNSLRNKMATAPSQKTQAPEPAQAKKATTPEPTHTPTDEKTRSLSDMIKKTPEQTKEAEKLVTSSRKAIDKLQDI